MLPSLWQIMEQSWYLYGAAVKKLLPLLGVLLGISLATNIYAGLTSPTFLAYSALTKNQQSTYTIILSAASLILFFVALLFLKQMRATWLKQPLLAHELLFSTLRVTVPSFLTALITSLTLVFGLFFLSTGNMFLFLPGVLLLIPGVVLFIFIFFGYFYTLFDGTGVIESLKKSWHLVRGRWFAVAERIIVPALLIGILSFCTTAIAQFFFVDMLALGVLGVENLSTVILIKTVIKSIVGLVFFPWISYCTLILFFELKKTPHL